ncbi:MAG: DEAD/DEAH box helicase family protein [Cyanobacteria bacterium NC_groundwater_1444_Ag_S-0.65um_54_12]|nr:DEAD/DEAH box helicase family protein [Cyanobacteria bacterium NC_groundwater_1444_Ag_S-0.65um_54_12]
MKLNFEPNLDYQLQAIEAVCDLFRGQEICRTEFTVAHTVTDRQMKLLFAESDLGIGNRLTLHDDELAKNLNDIQLRHGLAPSSTLVSGDFTVEMETGTGKTYVYLRTIFELNKRYGFTKFIIVVPSVAIKEGVYKSLQITEEHFKGLYAGVPFDYFLYDSAQLGQVRNFASSPQIQIMVVTVSAINKKAVNNLYKDREQTGGEKPIDLIKATRPIVIVDEPQSVDGGLSGAGKAAQGAMNPLCTLRYSATHVDQHHMIYRLAAVDAYERKLVKQIEVAAVTSENAYNKPYVRVRKVANRRGIISAVCELDMKTAGGVARREVTVRYGADLEQTTGRAVYSGCRIGEIRVERGNEYVELQLPGSNQYLEPGQAWGDVDQLAVQRQMIRRTIQEHLDKERRLRPQGIKVLSLFFIDAVARYRRYDVAGKPVKGEYAIIFEDEYRRAAKLPAYDTLFQDVDLIRAAEEVHNGYFSIDKRGVWTDTAEHNQSNRDNAERAYHLIMKEKEQLLKFETPLKFIFSHSALKEGWDNPNIFQICTLRDIQTERERRQTIGRGLRLCVNQNGERMRGCEINTLTVIAQESYEQFAESLQKEIEQDGCCFGGRLEIKNADERRQVRTRQAMLDSSSECQASGDRMKHQTTYRLHFDNEKLIESCINALQKAPPIPTNRLQWRKADIAIGKAGVEAAAKALAATVTLNEKDIVLPDLLTHLQERTQLTRRTIYRIVTGSGRLGDFKRNPLAFSDLAEDAINRCKRLFIS